jgi:hypothetical protein
LGFEVKVILPSQFEFSREPKRRFPQSTIHITSSDEIRLGVKCIRRDCLLNCQDRRQWLIFYLHTLCRKPTTSLSLAHNQRHDLSVVVYLVRGQQGLVMPHGANFVGARDIFGEEHPGDAGRLASFGGVAPQNPSSGMR